MLRFAEAAGENGRVRSARIAHALGEAIACKVAYVWRVVP